MKNRNTDQNSMRPQDIAVLLKIIAYGQQPWLQADIAGALFMSQSEMSKSLKRSKYAGLLDDNARKVRVLALMDFLEKGIAYVFPQRPGEMVRGVPTAHSAPPLNEIIDSQEKYVWPSARGSERGLAILPLYKTIPDAVRFDFNLYEMLALVDAIRVGNAREKKIAISELRKRILDEK